MPKDKEGGIIMVKRTRGVMKIIRKLTDGNACQKYVTAGNLACWKMMREVRFRKQPSPSDNAILAWANYDLTREIITGFWEFQVA